MDYSSPTVDVSPQLPAVVRNGASPGFRTAGRASRIAAWVLFGAAALALAGLYTFPYEAWQERLLADAGRRTGLQFTAERWTESGPAVIEWQGVGLAGGGIRLRADRVSCRLRPLTVLRSVLSTGDMSWEHLTNLGAWSLDGSVRLEGTGPDAAQESPAFSIHGLAHAAFEPVLADAPAEGGPRGGRDGRITLSNVSIAAIPVGPAVVPALSFQGLSLTVSCRQTLCRIESLSGTGPDGQLAGSGAVTLQRPLAASRLDGSLSLTLAEPAVLRGGDTLRAVAPPGTTLRLAVSGSLAQPRVSIAAGAGRP
jgi:type II secretion system protein N